LAVAEQALYEAARQLNELELASQHPAFLLHHVKCVDTRGGELFEFELLTEEECWRIGQESRRTMRGWEETLSDEDWVAQKLGVLEDEHRDWGWQRELLDWAWENEQTIMLKGRQLGVTWVSAGLALWYLLFRAGSDVLVYSVKEDDAVEVVQRIWSMFESLPEHLRNGVEVLKPARGKRPTTAIEVQHPNGMISSVIGMAATKAAGHGRVAALVIFDEASRQEYAREIWKAVIPATGDEGGKILIISTANGMSDEKSGEGNFFHHLWINSGGVDYPKLKTRFLGWWLHPKRTEEWYENVSLDENARAEQYPNNPEEAFLMSGSPYFDARSLQHYANNVSKPLFNAEFRADLEDPSRAKLVKAEGLPIEVYQLPVVGRKYAIAADVATGSGLDYSVGAVIDLHTMEPVAEVRMKAEYERFAEQLHFLGVWYNVARMAPEKSGGYGDTVIAYLRDGHRGRKPYSKMYRHRPYDIPGRPEAAQLGFPMNAKTRTKVLTELKEVINSKLVESLPRHLLYEARTFVYRDTKPSPRASDGANDDAVFAWAIVFEMFSEFGEHEHDRRKKTRHKLLQEKRRSPYPWYRKERHDSARDDGGPHGPRDDGPRSRRPASTRRWRF